MANKLQLEVVTAEKILFSTEADYVTIPGIVGELGILAGHLPVLTGLSSGVLTYVNGKEEKHVAVHYGFAEVFADKVTILAKVAEVAEDIDVERAKTAAEKASAKLDAGDLDLDADVLQAKLFRSLTRQSAHGK